MGEQADLMFDRMVDREINLERFWRKNSIITDDLEYLFFSVGNVDWKQKNGVSIKVRDMELAHLRNVVAMLERRGHDRSPAFRLYLDARESQEKLKSQHDAAQSQEGKT